MYNPFDSSSQYILEDERVLLRPMVADDYTHLAHFAAHQPTIWQYHSTPLHHPADMRVYIDKAIQARDAGAEYPYIIYDKQVGSYAGSTRYYDIQPANKSLLLGYTWYGLDYQRTGLNTHCKYLLLQFAFEVLGMERVEFRAHSLNAPSLAAMRRIGCTIEGTLRSHIPDVNAADPAARRDTVVLSILRPEWELSVRAHIMGML
jgi:N-acetyltransferase